MHITLHSFNLIMLILNGKHGDTLNWFFPSVLFEYGPDVNERLLHTIILYIKKNFLT